MQSRGLAETVVNGTLAERDQTKVRDLFYACSFRNVHVQPGTHYSYCRLTTGQHHQLLPVDWLGAKCPVQGYFNSSYWGQTEKTGKIFTFAVILLQQHVCCLLWSWVSSRLPLGYHQPHVYREMHSKLIWIVCRQICCSVLLDTQQQKYVNTNPEARLKGTVPHLFQAVCCSA